MSAAAFSKIAQTNTMALPVAAVYYATLDVSVFPLQPGSKIPYRGTRGVKDATTDIEQIARWWAQQPYSNIGIATGGDFGDVLDVDVKNRAPGMQSFMVARGAGLVVASWATASTPTSGLHVVYAPSGIGNHTNPKLGLDVRGAGGYIVAAPSLVGGYDYNWERIEIERYGNPLPWRQIVDLLDPQPLRLSEAGNSWLGSSDIGGLDRWLAQQAEGNRNSALWWAATKALSSGLDPDDLFATARAIGLRAHEVATTIRSARKRHSIEGRHDHG